MVFAPVGATLHAMSHLRPPVGNVETVIDADATIGATEYPASPFGLEVNAPDADASPRDAHHNAAAHCHVCDEWQFLDHVLPSAVLLHAAEFFADPPQVAPLPMRVFAETPWILPRAPPARLLHAAMQR